jgi:Protein of unknown function (DUF1573)
MGTGRWKQPSQQSAVSSQQSAVSSQQSAVSSQCSRAIAIALGILLIVTACLKITSSPGVGLGPNGGLLANPIIQSIAISLEIGLGCWLLSGSMMRMAWYAAIGLFTIFACVSGLLAFVGSSSCGCLGAISISPVFTLLFDAAVLVLLIVFHPNYAQFRNQFRPISLQIVSMIFIGVMGFIVIDRLDLQYRLRAILHGFTIENARSVDYGSVAAGSDVTDYIVVRNRGITPISIVGGTSDCTCLVASVPMSIPANSEAHVPVKLRLPQEASGRHYRRIELWTDQSRQPKLYTTIGFTVETGR